jgi:hypothetical protein
MTLGTSVPSFLRQAPSGPLLPAMSVGRQRDETDLL